MKKRKRKIVYHRVIILIVGFVLLVSSLLYGGVQLFQFITSQNVSLFNFEFNLSSNQNVVVIDAGHGGYDEGSMPHQGKKEKEITLDMAMRIGERLEAEDIEVIYTRKDDNIHWTNDNAEDIQARIDMGIENEADLFLSLHMNDVVEADEVQGHEIYVSMTNSINFTFAQNMNDCLNRLSYTNDRGIKDEANHPLMILNHNPVPAILVEMGYIKNQNDYTFITSEKGADALAKAMVEAILKTLETKD